ncbi:MAG: hypothetical protein MN733_25860 [Nitrososphaera sp.]|nr:hypothetical protein [Nitrososphaera sp.]
MSIIKPKLDWTWEYGCWGVYLFNGALDCVVKEAVQPGASTVSKASGYGGWEIIMGCCTYSRWKRVYYPSADEAKIACEELLLQVGQGLVKKLAAKDVVAKEV